MLEIQQISSSKDREKIIQNFNPTDTTWVVSDLRSKFSMQQDLVQKYGYFEDTTILRASELWTYLLKKSKPDLQIVSRDFILAWLAQELQKIDLAVARNGAENVVLEMLDTLAHLWTHPSGQEMLHDWWEQNPTAKDRWGIWADLVWKFSNQLLNENRICAQWISAYLSNQIGWELFWQKNLVVDLGAELSRPEGELLLILSRQQNVQLIQPMITGIEQFSFLLKPYSEVQGFAKKMYPAEKVKARKSVILQRMTSPLAEVKYVTSEIRKLIEQGIPADQVAVIAPEVENYWPLLQMYFSEEGLLTNKDQTCRLQSMPIVTWWLSRIRLAIAKFEYADLENVNFILNPEVKMRFEKFESLFKRILDSEDLNRNEKIQRAFQRSIKAEQQLSVSEFLGFIASYWQEISQTTHLESIMREILQNTRADISLQLGTWIFWLEQMIAKMEIKISSGYRNGVQVLNLSMSDQPNLKSRFFLGLTENNLKTKKVMLISPSEIEKIYLDLGFHLSHQEQSQAEFELRWLLQQENKIDHLCFPMTELSGQEATPHRVWMEQGGEKHHQVDIPQMTRHDLLQLQSDKIKLQERGVQLTDADIRIQQVEKDLAIEIQFNAEDHFPIQKEIQLSPSALESFQNCPFQFAASKVFRLLNPTEADLDSSHLTTGNLVHGLFELLTAEPRNFDYSAQDLEQMLDGLYEKISEEMTERGEYVGDQAFWPPLKNRIVQIGLRFLDHEKNIQLPGTSVTYREKKFAFEYDGLKWRGTVDRVDQIQGLGHVVYDYKAKNKDFEFKKWISHKKLQLGFYAWAIQKNLIQDLKDVEIIGAQYYIYKNFEKKGIDPYQSDTKKSLETFYPALESDISIMGQALKSGNFPAKPLDEEKTCEYCRWSQICRAPHLMK